MSEIQQAISQWHREVFGEPNDIFPRLFKKIEEEYTELWEAGTTDEAIKEMADLAIVLYALADRYGADLESEIQKKLVILRERGAEQIQRDADRGIHAT